MKFAYSNQTQPLLAKRDIFAMERDALSVYRQIASLGVGVVLVCWQKPRDSISDAVRSQYAERVVVCHEHTPGPRGLGSGTPTSNTNFGSSDTIAGFFEREFGVDPDAFNSVLEALEDLPES